MNTNLIQQDTNTLLNVIKNGRVNLDGNCIENDEYPLFSSKTGNIHYKSEALKSILHRNELQDIFFSKQNVQILQDHIRYEVWKQSNKKFIIDNQSYTQLNIIMRSIYLQYAENLEHEHVNQVKNLNNLVSEYCIFNILSNVNQYESYLNNIDKNPSPIDLPVYISNTGLKGM